MDGVYHLYDLADDPDEMRDLLLGPLSSEQERLADEMKAELASHIGGISASRLIAEDLPSPTRTKIRERLKALGYLQ